MRDLPIRAHRRKRQDRRIREDNRADGVAQVIGRNYVGLDLYLQPGGAAPPGIAAGNGIHRGIGDGGRRAADHTGLRIQSQSRRKRGRHGVQRDGSPTIVWHVRDDRHTPCVHHRGIAVAQPRGGGCWRRVAAVAPAAASGHQQDKRDWQTTQAVSGMHRMVLWTCWSMESERKIDATPNDASPRTALASTLSPGENSTFKHGPEENGMKRLTKAFALAVAGFALAAGCAQPPMRAAQGGFAVDTSWPKPLPNNWILGQVAGIAVDARDHVWIIHRPKTLIDEEKGAALEPKRAKCCVPAPAVIEFDTAGSVLHAWGGPGQGYEWFENEHGSYSTTLLGRPAHMEIDAQANELYVADGYGNKRVIVFDATTGAYKRHWGAYGKTPSDEKLPMYNANSPQFTNPVHCVRLSRDGLVYVCDRANNRVQVFKKDGTFVKQFVFEEASRGSGSSFDLVFSKDPQQTFLYLADGTNDQVLTIERESGNVITAFGRPGRFAGEFLVLHNIGIDSMGSLYTSEVGTGKRVQKFRPALQ